MLIRHSAYYLVGKGLPATINLIALAVFTRLLTPDEYGLWAIVVVVVGLANSIFFWWNRMALVRFLGECSSEHERSTLFSTLAATQTLSIATSGAAAALAYWLVPRSMALVTLLAVVLLWVQAIFELRIEVFRAQLRPMAHAVYGTAKAALCFGFAAALAYEGLGVVGLLLGTIGGMTLVIALDVVRSAHHLSLAAIDRKAFRRLLRFGLPLSLSYVVAAGAVSLDRIALASLFDASVVGIYAAWWDLTQKSINLVMLAVNMAAFPLAVRAFDAGGVERLRSQLLQNCALLLALAVPISIGLILFAGDIARLMLGEAFRATQSMVVPLLVFGAVAYGIKFYYVDQTFQILHRTKEVLTTSVVTLACTALALMILVSSYGMAGAAGALSLGCSMGVFVGWLKLRDAVSLPLAGRELWRGVATSLVAYVLTVSLVRGTDTVSSLGRVLAYALLVVIVGVSLNTLNARSYVLTAFPSRRR